MNRPDPPPPRCDVTPRQSLRVVHKGQHVRVEWWRKVGYRGADVLDWDAFLPMGAAPLTSFPGDLYDAIWSAVTEAAARAEERSRMNNPCARVPEPV